MLKMQQLNLVQEKAEEMAVKINACKFWRMQSLSVRGEVTRPRFCTFHYRTGETLISSLLPFGCRLFCLWTAIFRFIPLYPCESGTAAIKQSPSKIQSRLNQDSIKIQAAINDTARNQQASAMNCERWLALATACYCAARASLSAIVRC